MSGRYLSRLRSEFPIGVAMFSIASVLPCGYAHAQWSPPPTAMPLCTAPGDQTQLDFALGQKLICVWSDERDGTSQIYAQLLDRNGVPQWGGDGMLVSTDPQFGGRSPRVFATDSNDYMVFWKSGFAVQAIRLGQDGAPLWPSWITVGPGNIEQSTDADYVSGTISQWTVSYALEDGPSASNPFVPYTYTPMARVVDKDGNLSAPLVTGEVLSYSTEQYPNGPPFTQRVVGRSPYMVALSNYNIDDLSGYTDRIWSERIDTSTVPPQTNWNGTSSHIDQGRLGPACYGIGPSGPTAFFLNFDTQLLHNLTPGDGSIRWAALVDIDYSTRGMITLISDDRWAWRGGAYFTWVRSEGGVNSIILDHFSETGQGSWPGGSLTITSQVQSSPSPIGSVDTAVDPRTRPSEDGVLLAGTLYDDSASEQEVWIQRVSADGTVMWPEPLVVATSPGPIEQVRVFKSDDPAGDAVIGWVDRRSGSADLYVQRVTDWGSVGALIVTGTSSAQSLVDAINAANASPDFSRIEFRDDPNPSTPMWINTSLTSGLPAISAPVHIDGYSVQGAVRNRQDLSFAVLRVRIDGVADQGSGFVIEPSARKSIIEGLVIGRFESGTAVSIAADSCLVRGCFIGVLEDGQTDWGNSVGIEVTSAWNEIGGVDPQDWNVISDNGTGVYFNGEGARHNILTGAYIGTSAWGTRVPGLGNGTGVYIREGSGNVITGSRYGTTPHNLLISGNGTGLVLFDIGSPMNPPNILEGAYVGLGADGAVVASNGVGVSLQIFNVQSPSTPQQTVFSDAVTGSPYKKNYISGNTSHGIELYGLHGSTKPGLDEVAPATGSQPNVRITHSAIGVAADEVSARGNGGHGVYVWGGLEGHVIGGVIANNVGDGVRVEETHPPLLSGVDLRQARIFDNGGLGIDLVGSVGPDANDPGDSDWGPNDLMNYPTPSQAVSFPDHVEVMYAVDFRGGTQAEVSFFRNADCDQSGFGEGLELLGSEVRDAAESGANLVISIPGYVPPGSVISAMATDIADGSSSEFSSCVPVVNTLAGTGVTVEPVDPESGDSPVEVTFDEVLGGGVTSLSIVDSGPSHPSGFRLGTDAPYYQLDTDVTYVGNVTIRIAYDPADFPGPEDDLRLLHYDETLVPPQWVDITSSVDTDQDRIYGVTPGFSDFAVAQPEWPVGLPGGVEGKTRLLANQPNPFSANTRIRYEIASPAEVTLRVFDLSGRIVCTLVRGEARHIGPHELMWDGLNDRGRRVPPGVYFYRLTAGDFVQTRRMNLVR